MFSTRTDVPWRAFFRSRPPAVPYPFSCSARWESISLSRSSSSRMQRTAQLCAAVSQKKAPSGDRALIYHLQQVVIIMCDTYTPINDSVLSCVVCTCCSKGRSSPRENSMTEPRSVNLGRVRDKRYLATDGREISRHASMSPFLHWQAAYRLKSVCRNASGLCVICAV